MNFTCHQCKSYRVRRDGIGTGGHFYKCADCGHRFFVKEADGNDLQNQIDSLVKRVEALENE